MSFSFRKLQRIEAATLFITFINLTAGTAASRASARLVSKPATQLHQLENFRQVRYLQWSERGPRLCTNRTNWYKVYQRKVTD